MPQVTNLRQLRVVESTINKQHFYKLFFTFTCCIFVKSSINKKKLTSIRMDFGNKIAQLKKNKKLLRNELGEIIYTSQNGAYL